METGSVRSPVKTYVNKRTIVVWLALVICFAIGAIVHSTNISDVALKTGHQRHRRSYEDDYEDELCFEEVNVEREGGSLSSQGYPDSYPSDSNCSWLLVAPFGSKINILLSDLEIEESQDCAYDYVELFDGSVTSDPSFGRFCGRREKQLFVSTSSEALVVFVTDSAYEERGFKIEYSLVSENVCNKTVTDMEGVITSPNYPNHYPDNVDCWTVIKPSDPEAKIFIQFSNIDVEPTDDCEFDYIEIADGFSLDYPLLGRYCYGTESFNPIVSSGNSVLIHFRADHLVSGRGFSLVYSVITGFAPKKNPEAGDCLWTMNKLNGTIASPNYPNYYANDQQCIFLLEAPAGHQIRLTFETITMEDDPKCMFDHVEIFEEQIADSKRLGKFCGSTSPGTSVTSRGSLMYVRFQSDGHTVFNGFKATYVVVKETHEGGAITQQTKELCTSDRCEDDVKPLKGVTITSRPHNVTLTTGDSYAFTCGSNDPNSVVMWMKELCFLSHGEQILPGLEVLSNQTLIITDMSWKLEGRYTCVLVSSEGSEAVSAWVMLEDLDEHDECDLRFDYTPQDTAVLEHSFTFLRCFCPNAEITWELNGQLLETDELSQTKTLLPGLLLINRATKEDSGSYTCIAKSRELGCSVRIEATVLVTPQMMESCGQPVINEPNTGKPHLKKGKIVGGYAAAKGSSPWQVMLWEQKTAFFCGGSLVAAEWVVTAAHCLSFFKAQQGHELYAHNLYIKLGKTDKERKESHERIIGVREMILHPHYKKETFESDIALIRLKSPVEFSAYIMPICLGNERFLNSFVYERRVWGTVTGWGQLTESSLHPRFLMEIRLPLVEEKLCNESTKFLVTKNMFCAGYAQEVMGDACQGDSGGPFAVKENHRWYLAGVVSWGEGCGRLGKYGFYTKAGNFYSWIKDHIQSKELF